MFHVSAYRDLVNRHDYIVGADFRSLDVPETERVPAHCCHLLAVLKGERSLQNSDMGFNDAPHFRRAHSIAGDAIKFGANERLVRRCEYTNGHDAASAGEAMNA